MSIAFAHCPAIPTCLNSLGVAPAKNPLGDVDAAKRTAPASETTHVLSIFDLKINQCRWPLGDPTDARFTYCGERAPAKPKKDQPDLPLDPDTDND